MKKFILLVPLALLLAAAPVPTGSLDGVTPVDSVFPVTEGMTGHVVFEYTTNNLKKQDPPLVEIRCNNSFFTVGVADEVFAVQAGDCIATLFYYHWQGFKQTGPFVLDTLAFTA